MVILQFNKFIRNKWAWGAVAVLFCVMFVGVDLVSTLTREEREVKRDAGELGGEPVDAQLMQACLNDVRGYGRNRADLTDAEAEAKAYEAYAAIRTAEKNGVKISDAAVAEAVHGMFGGAANFNFERYRQLVVGELGLTPEQFEDYLRRQMMVREGIQRTLVDATVWTSPMELDQAIDDATDVFTVKVARFRQDKESADAVTVDEAGLKKWYDDNVKKLALPDLCKVRFVKFDATDADVLAKMTVNTNEIWDLYDQYKDERYTSTDTNGVETVKSYDEVKDELEKELRQIAAVEFYETSLARRAYANWAEGEDRSVSRLETIAAADGKTVEESGWFALDGSYHEGFTVRSTSVCPGARGFAEAVAELDPEVEDLRYGVVSSDRSVWLLERAAFSAAHTPSFEEAKGKIDAQALRDAKADAFKAEVEAIAAQGVEAVLATKDVSTNLTFAVSELASGAFPDQRAIAGAAMKTRKGEVSEFTLTGTGRALLVVCEDRVPGDAVKATLMRAQLRDQVAGDQRAAAVERWAGENLARLGYEAPADEANAE
ncbi:MAG: SurA N-terminal domain-containing protein [Kiritimatiellae bacterium]|nr:SurA N-terminal domain-containing protein [Kiritimatiellia bacterium]